MDLKKDIMVEEEMIYMSASADYADKVCSSTDNVEYNDSIRKAFIAGSEYAIVNQWKDADKELPADGEKVIVMTERGNISVNSVYTFSGKRNWHSNYKVAYWMYAPVLNKEQYPNKYDR